MEVESLRLQSVAAHKLHCLLGTGASCTMHCGMHENMQLGKHLPNISHNNYAMTCAYFLSCAALLRACAVFRQTVAAANGSSILQAPRGTMAVRVEALERID